MRPEVTIGRMKNVPGGASKAQILLGVLFLAFAGIHLQWVWKDQSLAPIGDAYAYFSNLLRFIDGTGRMLGSVRS